jgi:hypothetical protein
VYVIENLKKALKSVVGAGPSASAGKGAVRRRKPRCAQFEDDGVVPNNPTLPLRGARLLGRFQPAPSCAGATVAYFERGVGP